MSRGRSRRKHNIVGKDAVDLTSDNLSEDVEESNEELFFVKSIVNRRKNENDEWEYRVRWEGYGSDEDTWEPITNLDHAMDLVNDFNAKLKRNRNNNNNNNHGSDEEEEENESKNDKNRLFEIENESEEKETQNENDSEYDINEEEELEQSQSGSPQIPATSKAQKNQRKNLRRTSIINKEKKENKKEENKKKENEKEENNNNNNNDLEELEEEDDEEDDEENYEVEAIVNHRKRKGRMEYRIKWKGWDSSDNTWEKASNLDGCPKILKEYNDKYLKKNKNKKQSTKKKNEKNEKKKKLEKEKEKEKNQKEENDKNDQNNNNNNNNKKKNSNGNAKKFQRFKANRVQIPRNTEQKDENEEDIDLSVEKNKKNQKNEKNDTEHKIDDIEMEEDDDNDNDNDNNNNNKRRSKKRHRSEVGLSEPPAKRMRIMNAIDGMKRLGASKFFDSVIKGLENDDATLKFVEKLVPQ